MRLGTRDGTASHLSWKTPGNGGSDFPNYQIFRGTTPGGEALLGQTGNAKTTYEDTTTDPAVTLLLY